MLHVDDTMTDEPPLPPPSYQPPPIGPRRLHRSSNDRMVAGVCGGLAQYLGVDPTLVRIGAVVLTVAGGVGIVAYGAAWLLVPSDGPEDDDRVAPWQAIAIVVAAVVLFGWIDLWDDGPTVPLVLLAVGAVLVWGGRDDRSALRPTGARSADPAPPPASSSPAPVVEQTGPGRWSWSPPPPTAAAPPAPRRAPRHTGRAVAVGTGGVFLALGAISGAVGASNAIDPTVFLGLSLAGFGVLIAAGSFWGWSRPLSIGAMVIVFALALAAVVDVPLNGGVGDRTLTPAALADLPDTERLAVGHLVVDLTHIEAVGGTTRFDASVAIGELEVIVPEELTVEVRAEAGAGQVDVYLSDAPLSLPGPDLPRLSSTDDGLGASVRGVYEGTGPGTLVLDLEVGVGHVEVTRG